MSIPPRTPVMAVLDTLLNLAALLLWLSWRGIGTEQASGPPGTLLANLRPAQRGRPGRHGYLFGLIGLLLGRAVFYRQFGPAFEWHPSWSPGAVSVVFRSDHFLRMLASSLLGFFWMMFGVWSSACLVAALHRPPNDKDALTREIRRQLGWVALLPAPVLLVLPSLMLTLAWMVLGWVAAYIGLVPALHGVRHLFQQAGVVGLGAVLIWRWLLTFVLILYFVNSYVFFGASPVWDFIHNTGARLCRPLSLLRLGRLHLAPLVWLIVVWLAVAILDGGLPPLGFRASGSNVPVSIFPGWMQKGLLPSWYRSLPW